MSFVFPPLSIAQAMSIFIFPLLSIVQSQHQPLRGTFIDCGATAPSVIDGRKWLSDAGFVSAGTSKPVNVPGLLPILSTARSFPLTATRGRQKFCYAARAFRGKRYLVRTTYFYGGINGAGSPPPVFDQMVDGTFWSVVNTTANYREGMLSYYEGVFLAAGNIITVCLASNRYTDSDPFISALEFILLEDSVYNATDFTKYGLSLVARNSFGYSGPVIRYPDDQFDRFWEPFGRKNPTPENARNVSTFNFWNLPPMKIYSTELANSQPSPLELQWPLYPLPNSTYYIALYFADDRNSSAGSSRTFDVRINGIEYYHNLNVVHAGAVVFAARWPLAGLTKITLTPSDAAAIGPVINAGEIFDILPLGGRTHTRDVIMLQRVKKSLQNTPDWNGDPCLPLGYSWTGITCSIGPRIRVVSLNLTSMSLSGSLSPNVANLTALTSIWLGKNNLSGPIPDLGTLKMLKILHLEDNQFSGEIPSSLGGIVRLRELFLQGNNLTGQVPNNLVRKPGLNLRTLPGNHLSPRPSS